MHGEMIAMRKLRQGQGVQCRESSADFRLEEWIDNEVVGCQFEDVRHGKRLRQLLEQLSSRVGATTPWACQDWANTKAAYRFFGNERISESNILAGHFACTRERFSASRGFPLLVHDTTELSFRHEDTASIGIPKKIPAGHKGRLVLYTSCGILMHSSLVTTREGLPLGLAAIKFWNRDKFHGANALKRRVNPTRVPFEKKESIRSLENLRQSMELLADPGRCVHIGDRESDIYELFCLAQQLGTHFLVCTCVDRRAGDGDPDFAPKAIAGINRAFAQGAVAVKEWKNFGMEIKDSHGRYVLPDNPALTPIYRSIAEKHKTLIMHIADPDAAWEPPNPHAVDGRY
jgi:hypothetical protein